MKKIILIALIGVFLFTGCSTRSNQVRKDEQKDGIALNIIF